jgi:hypothetical protein
LLFGVGCGDDDDDGSAGAGGEDAGAAGSGGMDAGSSGTGGTAVTDGAEPNDSARDGGEPLPPTLADLEGTWQGPCVLQDGDYRRVTLVFSEAIAFMRMEFFGANNPFCQNVVFTIDMEMMVSVGDPAPGVQGAYHMNIEFTAVTAIMNMAEMVTYANEQGLAGYTDWELGVARDVAGRALASSDADAGTSGEPLPEAGTTAQLNFRLNEAKDRLYVSEFGGNGALGLVPYVKQ